MTEPEITVRKAVAYVPYSGEHADDYPGLAAHVSGVLDGSIKVGPDLPDPGPHPIWARLIVTAQSDPLLLNLLQLHKPHAVCHPASIDWNCHGEPPGGYEWEYAGWPCETVGIIADHLGVELTS